MRLASEKTNRRPRLIASVLINSKAGAFLLVNYKAGHIQNDLNGLADPDFFHLEKDAFLLADAMSSTHEIREIFLQKKDMAFEDWATHLRQLLARIDQEISLYCGVSVFKNGLHLLTELPELSLNPNTNWEDIPEQVFLAASVFGKSFDRLVKKIEQTDGHLPKEVRQNRILELCMVTTELIFNEFGLKGSDIARIY